VRTECTTSLARFGLNGIPAIDEQLWGLDLQCLTYPQLPAHLQTNSMVVGIVPNSPSAGFCVNRIQPDGLDFVLADESTDPQVHMLRAAAMQSMMATGLTLHCDDPGRTSFVPRNSVLSVGPVDMQGPPATAQCADPQTCLRAASNPATVQYNQWLWDFFRRTYCAQLPRPWDCP